MLSSSITLIQNLSAPEVCLPWFPSLLPPPPQHHTIDHSTSLLHSLISSILLPHHSLHHIVPCSNIPSRVASSSLLPDSNRQIRQSLQFGLHFDDKVSSSCIGKPPPSLPLPSFLFISSSKLLPENPSPLAEPSTFLPQKLAPPQSLCGFRSTSLPSVAGTTPSNTLTVLVSLTYTPSLMYPFTQSYPSCQSTASLYAIVFSHFRDCSASTGSLFTYTDSFLRSFDSILIGTTTGKAFASFTSSAWIDQLPPICDLTWWHHIIRTLPTSVFSQLWSYPWLGGQKGTTCLLIPNSQPYSLTALSPPPLLILHTVLKMLYL